MIISEDKKGNVLILKVSERLNVDTAPDLEKRLNELIESGIYNFIIDFSGLEYISSAGLKVLLEAEKKIKPNGGKLLICAIHGFVKDVFEAAGFNALFPIFGDEKEALKNP